MAVLRLTAALYGEIVGHAQAMLPQEAVGLLGGPNANLATLALPLLNRGGERQFLADPYSQFTAERELTRRALKLVAIYHSHPGGGAQLSPLDMEFARHHVCLQVVIALARLGVVGEEVRAYRVVAEKVVEVVVVVERSVV